MVEWWQYLLLMAVVFGANVLPAFGPPTWSILVLFRLHSHLNPVALVLLGALSAASGRMVLAHGTRLLRGRLKPERIRNLEAAKDALLRRKSRSALGILLFALSPVPSAQLFEAAGLLNVRLLPLTVAFFAGRLVSYSIYVSGTSALKDTGVGELVVSSFKSPLGVALQLLLLLGVVALAKVNWLRLLTRDRESAGNGEPSQDVEHPRGQS